MRCGPAGRDRAVAATARPAICPGARRGRRSSSRGQLERRSMRSPEGRAVLLHAPAHIEFNAINLALDAVWRFADARRVLCRLAEGRPRRPIIPCCPTGSRIRARIRDFPAHNGLWEMCERTRGDVLARMALVPRTLEARGLDASPPIRARLVQAGDDASAAILDVILRDESAMSRSATAGSAICAMLPAATRADLSAARRAYHAPGCAVRSISMRGAMPVRAGRTRRTGRAGRGGRARRALAGSRPAGPGWPPAGLRSRPMAPSCQAP
ncbi:ferritin-like domain-containing protein [Burkholderia cenocepacia]|uniref:ferritin-like domain-containing protein n=1 Tax=Burkholderia cenocepacia TaxID=95486 RepID=UPI0022392A42|nr:ferritin-like domain-containing protein [Burkholderia cenocepacia]